MPPSVPLRRREAEGRLNLPRVRWSLHMANLQWRQGEHTVCLGPTGKGKSTLVRNLLKYREQRNAHVLIIATKSANSFEQLTPGRTVFKSQLDEHSRGYYLTKSWRKAKNGDYERVLLWVRYTGQESINKQKREIDAAMQDVMSQGAWTVYIDELRWFTDRLKLSDWVTDAWTQGREIKVSLIGSSQRPAWITRDIYANSTHFYIWSTQDKEDLDRLSGIGGMDSRLIRQAVAELEGHDVLYINAYEKVLYVTRAPAPSKET